MGTQGLLRTSAVFGRPAADQGGFVRLALLVTSVALVPFLAGCSSSSPFSAQANSPPPNQTAGVPPPPNYAVTAAGQPAYAPPPGQPAYTPPQGQPTYPPPPGQPAYAPRPGQQAYAPQPPGQQAMHRRLVSPATRRHLLNRATHSSPHRTPRQPRRRPSRGRRPVHSDSLMSVSCRCFEIRLNRIRRHGRRTTRALPSTRDNRLPTCSRVRPIRANARIRRVPVIPSSR